MAKLPIVAIIGRANAGKSSLFNRLVKSQQAIVAREAGTTCDSVIGKVAYQRRSAGGGDGEFMLIDTAGLKSPEDEFEAGIQEQIEDAATAADVILVVVDTTNYPGDEERIVAKKALKSRKPVILVTNKADLKESIPDEEFRRLGIKDIIRTSAEHNSGTSELLDRIATLIPEAHDTEPDNVGHKCLLFTANTVE